MESKTKTNDKGPAQTLLLYKRASSGLSVTIFEAFRDKYDDFLKFKGTCLLSSRVLVIE